MKNKKGFTLVELLVVIAIIGILSTVAVVNLNSARNKAKVAAVQGSLSGIIPGIILCHDADHELLETATVTDLCDGTVAPTVGVAICDDTSAPNWPALPSAAWSYGFCDSSVANGTFTYSATDTTNTVLCTEDGCVTS